MVRSIIKNQAGSFVLNPEEQNHLKRLKVFNIILVMTFVFIVPPSLNGQSNRASQYKITYYGFGPVKVGMKVSAASKALGIPFTELDKKTIATMPIQKDFSKMSVL